MFDQEFVSKLGTKSISRDTVLTKERAAAAWSGATKAKQQEVLTLADVPYSTAYRVRSTGTITTKMAIAYSQVLDLDPYYLIGAVPENAGYSFIAAKRLLMELKYAKAIQEYERRYIPKKADAPPAGEATASGSKAAADETAPDAEKAFSLQAAMQKLSEDDMITLFRGLIIQAGAGKPQAIADITKIIKILLG